METSGDSYFQALSAWGESVKMGDVLRLTRVLQNGWLEGFKTSDPEHTLHVVPASHLREVQVKATSTRAQTEPEPEPEPRQAPGAPTQQLSRGVVSPQKTMAGAVDEIRWELQLEEAHAPTLHEAVERAQEQLGLQPDERSPLSQQVAEICYALSIDTGWENQRSGLSGQSVEESEQAPAVETAPEALQPAEETAAEQLAAEGAEPARLASIPHAGTPFNVSARTVDADDHNAIQMLLMVTGKSEPECRRALAAAGGDMKQASVSLLQPPVPSLEAENDEQTDDLSHLTLSVQDEEREHVPEHARARQHRPSSPSSPRASLSEAMDRLCDGLLSKESVEDTFHRIDTVRLTRNTVGKRQTCANVFPL